MKQRKTSNGSTEQLNIFGPAPLLEGEDIGAYDALLAGVSGAVKPKDLIEEILARDTVDLHWSVLRLRRYRDALMATFAPKGLRSLLDTFDLEFEEDLVHRWAERDPQAIAEVKAILDRRGLSSHAVMAQTFLENIETLERFEHLIARTEARRNSMQREIERHRFETGQALPQSLRRLDRDGTTLIENPRAI